MTIGQVIKQLRKERCLTQQDMEKRTGIRREYLSRIESNVLCNPTVKMLKRITMAFGITLADLLSRVDEDTIKTH